MANSVYITTTHFSASLQICKASAGLAALETAITGDPLLGGGRPLRCKGVQVTHSVAILARWMAADLYLREVDALRFELSQNHASDEVWRLAREITTAQHAQGDGHPAAPGQVTHPI